MYASAWIFVSSPIVVSFSTSEPRPMTTSSPISTRSRTQAWSPTITRAPSFVPAKTTAPVETTVPGPSSSGGGGPLFPAARRGSGRGLPELEGRERLLLRRRPRRQRRLLAHDGVVEDLAAVSDPRARIDHRRFGDLIAQCAGSVPDRSARPAKSRVWTAAPAKPPRP